MSAPDLTIVVVSFNTRELTLACLASVFEETRATPFELIVVDNASSDGSADAIDAAFGARLRLVRSAENLGFAAANNLAAQSARGRLLLLLNPDTVVLDGAIDRIVSFAARRPDAGVWGGRTVFADRSLNPSSCWGRPTLRSLAFQACGLSTAFPRSAFLNPEGIGGWKRDTERAVDIVSGCFLLIGRDLWERLGGFDRRFFMYGEDADLCLRAAALGARPAVTPDATIVHLGGRSEAVRADKIVRLYTARMQLLDRHLPGFRASAGRWLQRGNVLRRWFLWTARATFGNARARDAARVFSEVWARRRQWLGEETR